MASGRSSHRNTPPDALARDHGRWQVSWLAGRCLDRSSQGLSPPVTLFGPRSPLTVAGAAAALRVGPDEIPTRAPHSLLIPSREPPSLACAIDGIRVKRPAFATAIDSWRGRRLRPMLRCSKRNAHSRDPRHVAHRRTSETDQAVADHRGDRQGAQAQGGRARHHRAGRGRARFRHAAEHQGRGQARHRQGRHQIHPGRRHGRAETGDLRQVQARERPRLHPRSDQRRRRRQAGAVQRAPGHGRPRRRGDRAGALLGFLHRHRRAGGRQAGGGGRDPRTTASRSGPRSSRRRFRPRPSGSSSTRPATPRAPPTAPRS